MRIIWLLLIISFGAPAEPAETELRKLLRDYDGFSAQFIQQVTDSEGNRIHNATGNLIFKQPGMFKWQVVTPEEEMLQSNGETLWWYNPFLEQVTIFDAKNAVSKTPFALLVSNNDETWNQFHIEKVESGFVIEPKDVDNSQVIKLTVLFESFLLQQIIVTDRTRQKSAFRLSKHKFNSNQNYNFNFVIPKDIEVDDQR